LSRAFGKSRTKRGTLSLATAHGEHVTTRRGTRSQCRRGFVENDQRNGNRVRPFEQTVNAGDGYLIYPDRTACRRG
jgi:hypothetical protein